MKYAYTGVTKTKEKVKGVIEAKDEVEAGYKLRAMQVRPLSLRKGSNLLADFDITKLNDITIGNPVPLKGMLVFTRQFSSLIDAGVPVVQCLDILSQQETNRHFKSVLIKIKESIEGGGTLADSMGKHPNIFSPLFVSLIEAGEVSGSLEITLRRIGVQLEKTDRIRAKVKSAMMYPIITLIVATVVLIFLLVKVIPEVAKLYSDSNAKLPEITIMVLDLSNWFQNNYMLLIGYIIGFIATVAMCFKVPKIRQYVDPIMLRIPAIGPLIKKSAITAFSRTMATLVSSGVPLLSAFEISSKLMSNLAIKKVVDDTAQSVSEGKSVAFGLSQKSIFPPMVVHMVSIGEVTGKLDELLGKIADMYEEEVDEAVDTVTGLLQPILIVGVGGIIAFLLLSMYLPIFQLAEKATGGL